MPSSRNRFPIVADEASRLRRALPGIVAALALAPVIALTMRHDRLLADDAYITFRYARNLAAGQGLVYNVSDMVLGTSTPLFALLLAGGARLGLDLPQLGVWLGVFSWAGVVLILAWYWRRDPLAAAAPLLVLAASVTFRDNLGMESPLYALLCLSSLLLAGSGRTVPAAALAGLAAITRLDGGLVAAVLLLWLLTTRRRLPWRETGTILLFVVPWYAFAWWTYGSPLPQSLQAKAGLARSLGFGGGDFVRGGLDLLRARIRAWPALMALLPAVLSGLTRRRDNPAATPYVLWGFAYMAAYWLSGMPQFGWYYVPLAPWVALPAQAGLSRLARARGTAPRAGALALSLSLLLAAGQMAVHSWRHADVSPARASAYREMGEWLGEHALPGDRVALLEIGVVGYYGSLPVVDTMGLVSPYLGERLVDWGQSLVLAIQHEWPEYALVVDTTAWEAIERQEWFRLAYHLQLEVDRSGEADPAARMRLYRRAPAYPPRAHTALTLHQAPGLFAALREAGLHGPPLLTPGAPLHLVLAWECRDTPTADLPVLVRLESAGGSTHVLISEPGPLRGGLPTTLWRPGEVIREFLSVVLPTDLPPGKAGIFVTLGDREVASASVVVSPTLEDVSAHGEAMERVPFPPSLALVGSRLETPEAMPGGVVDLSLAWQAMETPPADWSVFVHLVDAEERPLAQFDGYPFAGYRPTSTWEAGQVYVDTYSLPLPPGLAPGRYRLLVGLYDWSTGERLTPTSDGTLPARALVVADVLVTSGR